MKRSGYIQRRTRLRTYAQPRRGGRLPVMSKKRRAEQPARRRCLAVLKARSGGRCELRTPVCTGWGCDGHEPLARAQGGDPNDPNQSRWTCRECHEYTRAHRAESIKRGWIIERRGLLAGANR